MNVVDSSGWLEYFAAGPNVDFFVSAIEAVDELVVPTVGLCEVFRRVLQQRGEGDALQAVALMRYGTVVELTPPIALDPARTGVDLCLPMADSMILATARARQATLWTQDADFQGGEGVRCTAARVVPTGRSSSLAEAQGKDAA